MVLVSVLFTVKNVTKFRAATQLTVRVAAGIHQPLLSGTVPTYIIEISNIFPQKPVCTGLKKGNLLFNEIKYYQGLALYTVPVPKQSKHHSYKYFLFYSAFTGSPVALQNFRMVNCKNIVGCLIFFKSPYGTVLLILSHYRNIRSGGFSSVFNRKVIVLSYKLAKAQKFMT
jgi:hypothetical protein